MEFVRNTLEIVALALSVVYAAWPLVVLSPLARYRHNLLGGMTAVWGFTLLSFLATMAIGQKPRSFLIPEPLNTYLFSGPAWLLSVLSPCGGFCGAGTCK